MKKAILVLLGCVFLTGMICFILARHNRALQKDAAHLIKRITRLEAARAENAELRIQLSRQQAAELEVERLRQEAKDVYRLRGQVGELLRLRREHSEMIRYVNGLTNRLDELLQNNQDLALQVGELSMHLQQLTQQNNRNLEEGAADSDAWAVWDGDAWVIEGGNASMDGDRPAIRDDVDNAVVDVGEVNGPRRTQPGTVIRLPPNHPLTSESCVSCHVEREVKPQLLSSMWLGWDLEAR